MGQGAQSGKDQPVQQEVKEVGLAVQRERALQVQQGVREVVQGALKEQDLKVQPTVIEADLVVQNQEVL